MPILRFADMPKKVANFFKRKYQEEIPEIYLQNTAYSFYLWWGQILCFPLTVGLILFGSHVHKTFDVDLYFCLFIPWLIGLTLFLLTFRREYLYFDSKKITYVRSKWYCVFCMQRDEIAYKEVVKAKYGWFDAFYFYLADGKRKRIVIDISRYPHRHSFVARNRLVKMLHKKNLW